MESQGSEVWQIVVQVVGCGRMFVHSRDTDTCPECPERSEVRLVNESQRKTTWLTPGVTVFHAVFSALQDQDPNCDVFQIHFSANCTHCEAR